MSVSFCSRCKEIHDWSQDEYMECIPPRDQIIFCDITMDPAYKEAVYEYCPLYCTEEIVGSYLGHNPNFPSQEAWLEPEDFDSEEEK